MSAAPQAAPFKTQRLSVQQFTELLAVFAFTRRITEVHMHHTWAPTRAQWRGEASVRAMRDFHVHENGWADIGQHVTIAPDGYIWTGRSWNLSPCSDAGDNGTSAVGPFMFETVGNFDVGHDPFDGVQRWSVVEVIARVQRRFNLPVESLRFHRDLPGCGKTCPGTSVSRTDVLAAVRQARARLALAA